MRRFKSSKRSYQNTPPDLCLFTSIKNHEPWQDRPAYRTALYLRIAIANAGMCRDKTCRRQHICSRPPLLCLVRPRADIYNWDWGWPACRRKPLYGLKDESSWIVVNPRLRDPDKIKADEQRQIRIANAMKMNMGEDE